MTFPAMTTDRLLTGIGAVVVLVILTRILVPVVRRVIRRARMHGPARVGTPNSAGTWFGWVVSIFWSLNEEKNEEAYEYMRQTQPEDRRAVGPPKPSPLPQLAASTTGLEGISGDSLFPRTEQQITEDGHHWWSGREWVETDKYAPPSAPRSTDGSHWWDGERWRWVPNEFATTRALPSQVDVVAKAAPRAQVSWLEKQRGDTPKRKLYAVKRKIAAERSDPPPTNLPKVAPPPR